MITQAAVLLELDNLPVVIPVHRHGDIGIILKSFGYKPNDQYRILEQGFIDEHSKFYNRIDAMKEAIICGQRLIGRVTEELFSENLY